MILDAIGGNCHTVNFKSDSGATFMRQWDIRVQQYACGNEDVSGPSGCLQYYTSQTGLFQTFNFPQPGTQMIGAGATHLSNQNYKICIRRQANACYICYATQMVAAPAIINQVGFGLSASGAASLSQINAMCTTDYITVSHLCHLVPVSGYILLTPSLTLLSDFCFMK